METLGFLLLIGGVCGLAMGKFLAGSLALFSGWDSDFHEHHARREPSGESRFYLWYILVCLFVAVSGGLLIWMF
jgi:hypothetical protein